MFHFPMKQRVGISLAARPPQPAAREQRVDNRAFMLQRQWIVTDTCLITIIVLWCLIQPPLVLAFY